MTIDKDDIYQSIEISPPGKSGFIQFEKGDSVKVKLIYKSSINEKGVIWMNPSTNEIKVDLKQTYQWKYGFTYLNKDIFGERVEKTH